MVFDAQEYLSHKLRLSPGRRLRVFHHTPKLWGVPGEKTEIAIAKNRGQMAGRHWGAGFNTSTQPEPGYGEKEFQLEVPFEAFKGKTIFVPTRAGKGAAPPSQTFIVAREFRRGHIWFIFLPKAEAWLNRSATAATFDGPRQHDGWD